MILLLSLLIGALAPGPPEYEPGKVSTIKTDKLHYALRVPKKMKKKRGAPAIVFIHGSNMRGENYAWSLASIASLNEWVLIGPTGPNKVNDKQYNHGPGDEKYVAAIIEDVEKRLGLTLTRIYVGGHSQGAFLSHAVAAALPEKIDGILAVSGGSWVNPRRLTRKGKGRPRTEVPVAIVHAQDDPVVGVRASIAIYDAYVKAKHEDVRLFAPTQGAHMFMRLPIVSGLAWLDLMNETSKTAVSKVSRSTDREKDPRTVWDAARMTKRLAKKMKMKGPDAALKKITRTAKDKARDLQKRLKKGADDALIREAYTFLSEYGMAAADGDWRKALTKAMRKR